MHPEPKAGCICRIFGVFPGCIFCILGGYLGCIFGRKSAPSRSICTNCTKETAAWRQEPGGKAERRKFHDYLHLEVAWSRRKRHNICTHNLRERRLLGLHEAPLRHADDFSYIGGYRLTDDGIIGILYIIHTAFSP